METIKKGMLLGFGICLVFSVFGVVSVLVAQTLNSFSKGDTVSSSLINDNFNALKNRITPVGGIVAWHKDLNGSVSLTNGWVECNGQTINDVQSPYNGMTAPNLNGDAAGANSPGLAGKYTMFLRGATTSGTGQLDAFQGHHHSAPEVLYDRPGDQFINATFVGAGLWWNRAIDKVADPVTDGSNGAPRTGSETRPVNMSVVWVMRIK